MASLNDDHSWRCRICRVERLVGRRTQAALTAGILAVASVAPTAAFAQQGGGNGSAVSDTAPADFDLGGGSDDLAEEMAGEPAVDVSAPPEQVAPPAGEVPKTDPAVPVPEVEAAEDPDVPEAPAEVPVPAPESAAPAPAATAEPAPPSAAESAPEAEDVVEPRPAERSKGQRSRKTRTTPRVVPAVPPAQPATPAAGQAVTPVAPPAATPPAVVPAPAPAAAAPRLARATRGWHVIRSGESLWSIAAERLGSGASTASVAAEVERLWALNQDRIGTGDRNVVLAGTKIKL